MAHASRLGQKKEMREKERRKEEKKEAKKRIEGKKENQHKLLLFLKKEGVNLIIEQKAFTKSISELLNEKFHTSKPDMYLSE